MGFQERLIIEYSELKVRIDKLVKFLRTYEYELLSLEDKLDLVTQLRFMTGYAIVLSKRLKRLGKEV